MLTLRGIRYVKSFKCDQSRVSNLASKISEEVQVPADPSSGPTSNLVQNLSGVDRNIGQVNPDRCPDLFGPILVPKTILKHQKQPSLLSARAGAVGSGINIYCSSLQLHGYWIFQLKWHNGLSKLCRKCNDHIANFPVKPHFKIIRRILRALDFVF